MAGLGSRVPVLTVEEPGFPVVVVVVVGEKFANLEDCCSSEAHCKHCPPYSRFPKTGQGP